MCSDGTVLGTLSWNTKISLAKDGKPYTYTGRTAVADPKFTLLATEHSTAAWTYTVAASTSTTFDHDDIETDLKGNFYVLLHSSAAATMGNVTSIVKLAGATGTPLWTVAATALCPMPAGADSLMYSSIDAARGGSVLIVRGVLSVGSGATPLFVCFLDGSTGGRLGSYNTGAAASLVPAGASTNPVDVGYDSDDFLYALFGKTTLLKVNPRAVNTPVWAYTLPDTATGIAAVGTNGMLYITTKRSFIVGVSTSSGTMTSAARTKFMVRLSGGSSPTVLLSSGNVLYVTFDSSNDSVYAVSGSSGKVLWTTTSKSFGPTLGSSGYLHMATSSAVVAVGASSSSSSKKADSGTIAGAVIGSLLGMALLCGIIVAVLLSTGVLSAGKDKKHDKASEVTANPMAHAKQ